MTAIAEPRILERGNQVIIAPKYPMMCGSILSGPVVNIRGHEYIALYIGQGEDVLVDIKNPSNVYLPNEFLHNDTDDWAAVEFPPGKYYSDYFKPSIGRPGPPP